MKERTKYSNMNYECQDIFMVRIPSMPIEVFKKIDSYDQGVISFLNENKTIKGDFEEALLLASQSTYQSLISVPEKPKKNRNLELGVCKYITRMSTRPTPYGMFAGVGLGKFSGRDSLTISTDKHRKDVSVDTYWLEHIIHKIELEANLFPKIELIWNNNCYIKGDRVKNPYFSNHGDNEQNESFENSSIRFNELISIIIKSTQNFVPYSKLVEIIKEYYEDVSNNLIDKILLELIENEYLLTDLRLPAYCDEPLEYVINKLLYLDNIHDLVDKLQDIKKAIDDYQEKGNACILRDIYSKMQKIHKTSNYLVVNKGLTSDFSLTKKVKEDLEKFAEVYSELLPESGTYSELNAFKHDFEEEYGTNVRVPLLEVIDENGFNGLSKIEKQTRTITGKEAIIKGYIDRQIVKALINNGDVVKIESQVLKKLLSEEKIVSPSYPVSFDMNFFIYQDRQPGQYHYSIGPNFGSQKAGKMFQPFMSMRDLEQVRTDLCYQNLPVRIIANYSGLTGNGGSTHYAMEDMALFSSLVNMTVCAPADPEQLRQIILKSVDWAGPMAIRMDPGKNNAVLYPEDAQFEIGKAYTACEGSDITIIACGEMVAEAIKISKELKKEGISVRVLDMFTVKPLDREAVIRAAEETGRIITWEDHLMNNGLSSAVSDVLTDNCIALESFKRFGIPQVYPGFGDAKELYKKYGYDKESVQNYIRSLF